MKTKNQPASSHVDSSDLSNVSKTFRTTVIALAVSSALVVVACGGDKKQATGDQPAKADAGKPSAAPRPVLTVNVVKPQVSDWPVRLSANGNIVAWQEAIVGAEANGLRLNDVRVNVGDQVRKGQVIATLAADTSRADVAVLAASVAEAEAALAEAQANAARARSLQDSGALSAQQINQFLTAEKTANARLAATKAQAQSGQLRLGFTRVLAPDDGVISARAATVGAVVSPGQELFRLIRQNRLEWRGEVTAAELPRVVPGQKVVITTPSGQVVNGKVRAIAPTVDPQTRNALTYVDLERSSAAKPGMFAKGEFDLSLARAVHVPQSAVVARDGFTFVMRVDASNKVTQVKVQPARRNGDRLEIKEGLKEGDTIVANGAAFLTEGDTVRVVEATTSSSNPAPVTSTSGAANAAKASSTTATKLPTNSPSATK
jgi:HlyD family secretion protein